MTYSHMTFVNTCDKVNFDKLKEIINMEEQTLLDHHARFKNEKGKIILHVVVINCNVI